MQIRSPIKNGSTAAAVYAGIAVAAATKDPRLVRYLIEAGFRGMKNAARTDYNNGIVAKLARTRFANTNKTIAAA